MNIYNITIYNFIKKIKQNQKIWSNFCLIEYRTNKMKVVLGNVNYEDENAHVYCKNMAT